MNRNSVRRKKETTKKKKKNFFQKRRVSLEAFFSVLLSAFFSVLLFLYFETVFAVSTGTNPFTSQSIGILLFSIFSGTVYFTITAFFSEKVRFLLKIILLLLLSFVYGAVYFVFCSFRIFYDLPTMLSGASGLTEFVPIILHLFTSPSGLLHIFLFLLPLLLYCILLRRFEKNYTTGFLVPLCGVITAGLFFCINLMHLELRPQLNAICHQEYNFTSAIQSFGLLPALALDTHNLTGKTSDEDLFEPVDAEITENAENAPVNVDRTPASIAQVPASAEEPPAGAEKTPASVAQAPAGAENAPAGAEDAPAGAEEAPVVTEEISAKEPTSYGYNILDIDFAALAETTSGTLASMDKYVASLTPSSKNAYTGLFEGKNLILITAEAFTEEVIDPVLTPTLYRLATKGIQFTDYYQPASAGTTGGEYGVLMGMLPGNGGSSMKDTSDNYNYMTIGTQLCNLGYYGKAFHNYTYTVYNRNVTHNALGYSDGFMGMGNGMEKLITAQWPESDREMMEATLPLYIDRQPFNIYYMTVSGHSLYTRSKNKQTLKHWEEVADLEYSDLVKGYLAAQLELENALSYLVNALEEAGIADDTVICLSTDHFPYGLDSESDMGSNYYLSELYGTEITDTFVRDHNRLILWSGCLEDMEPIVVDSPTFSPDILPTLLNLFGVDFDSRLLPGRDVLSDAPAIIYTLGYDWKTDLGYYLAGKNKFYPNSEDTEIPEDYVKTIRTIVKNKINYNKSVLDNDYFRHVFPSQ